MGPKWGFVEFSLVFIGFLREQGGIQWRQTGWDRSNKEGFEENFPWGGWQNNVPQRGREAYFQEFGFTPHENTAKLEDSMEKS